MHLKMSFGKCRSSCQGLNVLMISFQLSNIHKRRHTHTQMHKFTRECILLISFVNHSQNEQLDLLFFSIIQAWINDYIHVKQWYVITYPCPSFNIGLVKPSLRNNYTPQKYMMTSSNGNIFRVTGHLCGKFTGHRWISHTKASDAELWCLLWSEPEWTVE